MNYTQVPIGFGSVESQSRDDSSSCYEYSPRGAASWSYMTVPPSPTHPFLTECEILNPENTSIFDSSTFLENLEHEVEYPYPIVSNLFEVSDLFDDPTHTAPFYEPPFPVDQGDNLVLPPLLVQKLQSTRYSYSGLNVQQFYEKGNAEGSYWVVKFEGHPKCFVCNTATASDGICSTISTSYRGINRHFRAKEHVGLHTTMLPCNHPVFPCGKTFTRQDVLKRHVDKARHKAMT